MNILTVKQFNEQQNENWESYCAKCNANNLKPQTRSNFNQFITFDYKTGFVLDGKYPEYFKSI